jgi:spore germination protein KB
MIHISKHQLFCLMMLFEIGSTSLFVLGIEAKQDAWIAILLGTAGGLFIIWIYTELQRLFPESNLVEITISLIGRTLGIPLVLLYGLYFFYKSGIILREFSELILISYLPQTPVIYVSASLIAIILYVSCSGLEVLARTSEIFLFIVLIYIISTYILITVNGRIDLNELRPVLAKGIKPVIYAAYPRILNFPFGESLVFLMYWRHVNSKEAIRKASLLSSFLSGLLFTVSAIIIISVLGVEFASSSTVPFLQVVKLINLGNIITNLDAIGVTVIFIGGFYKITIFFYGTVFVFNSLFKIKESKLVTMFVGILVLWFSYTFISSYQFSLWLGKKIHPLLMNTPLLVVSPILLLCIAYAKSKKQA